MVKPNLYRIPAPPPGRLTTMPRPRGGDWLDDELLALRTAGVDVLASLLTEPESTELMLADEPFAAVRAGIEFHACPIVDLGVPDYREVAPLLDRLVAHLRAGRHVAVHCRAGIGRSSLVAAVLLVRLGVPVDDAWDVLALARGVPVPETDEQRQWVYHHAQRAAGWPL